MRPDVVIATPLVVLKTTQLDLLRAAIELGIRNVFAVASWDNLSSKGELTFAPQQIVVWNEVQRREAADLHQIDPPRVIVTGAQVFDEWFETRPSTIARGVLRPRRPARRSADRAVRLLGACSKAVRPSRVFVEQWVRHLRGSGEPGPAGVQHPDSPALQARRGMEGRRP